MVFSGDQLVRDRDAHHIRDAGECTQVQGAEALDVTDQSDDRPLDSAGDEGLAARRGDPVDDGIDLAV